MLLEVCLAVHSVRSLDHSRVFQLESYLYYGIIKTIWVFEFIIYAICGRALIARPPAVVLYHPVMCEWVLFSIEARIHVCVAVICKSTSAQADSCKCIRDSDVGH